MEGRKETKIPFNSNFILRFLMTILWPGDFSSTSRMMSHFPDKAYKYISSFWLATSLKSSSCFPKEVAASRRHDLLPSLRHWMNPCVTYQQLRGVHLFSIRGIAEVVRFLFSAWKALSLGMRHSCFLSEASRNCYIF